MTVRYKVTPNQVQRFSMEVDTKDDRHHRAAIRSLSGAEDFRLGDTVVASLRTTASAAADTLDSVVTLFTMNLGPDFDYKLDDSLYAFQITSHNKSGEVKSSLFEFKSDKPVPAGKDPEAGEIRMRVDYADGTFEEVAGRIETGKTVDVVITSRDGKRLHVVWKDGKGILIERL